MNAYSRGVNILFQRVAMNIAEACELSQVDKADGYFQKRRLVARVHVRAGWIYVAFNPRINRRYVQLPSLQKADLVALATLEWTPIDPLHPLEALAQTGM